MRFFQQHHYLLHYVVYLNQQEQFLVSLRNGVLFVLALSDAGGVLAWVAC